MSASRLYAQKITQRQGKGQENQFIIDYWLFTIVGDWRPGEITFHYLTGQATPDNLDSCFRRNDNVAVAATAKQKPQVKPGAKQYWDPRQKSKWANIGGKLI